MDEFLHNPIEITEAERDRAMVMLYKKGHLFIEDEADKDYFRIVYECFDEINEILSHFGIRAISDAECNNIYLENIKNAPISVSNNIPLKRNRSVMLVILAIRLWNSNMNQPATMTREELYREFFTYMPKDANKKNADASFESALEYCTKNGFIRTVPDDEKVFLILPYLKCRIKAEEVRKFSEQLKNLKLTDEVKMEDTAEEGEMFDE